MVISVKHKFQSAKTDSGDASLVRPSNWNDEHDLLLATNKLLGRATSGTGTVEEIGLGNGVEFSGGNLLAKIGDGLEFNAGATRVKLGSGLQFDAGALSIQPMYQSGLSGLRNKLINGGFTISQRVTSAVIAAGASAYTLDRLLVTNNTNQPVTVSQQDTTPGQVIVPGNPRKKVRFAFGVAPTTGTLRVEQRIEDVFTLSGKAASSRAYFTGPAGAETLAAEIVQNFGTGGSPSGAVTTAAASLDVATIYDAATQKRRAQFIVPSVLGKTLGTGNNDYLSVAWTLTPRQVGNYELSRMSFVEGDASAEDDPFAQRHQEEELSLAQRYFQWTPHTVWLLATAGNQTFYISKPYLVQFRAIPSIGAISPDPDVPQSNLNNSGNVWSTYGPGYGVQQVTALVAGVVHVTGYRFPATAEL